MIRVALDTNVYVAALLSREGSPARILRALSDGLFDAVVCPRLMGELEGVLARPKINRSVTPNDARMFVQWLSRVAIPESDPRDTPRLSCDPDDDFILALAVESGAAVVVSGDAHLLDLGCTGPRVLSPSVFADVVDSLR